jgi:hypothetical protein
MQDSIMRPYRTFAVKAFLVAFACLLVSCSAIRLGYSNGESVVYWWLNSYVDVQSDQSPWVKKHIDGVFAWHRKTQLYEYAQLLAQAQKQLQHNVTQADVLNEYDVLKKSMLLIIDKSLPGFTDLALSLQPQQIAHLEKKFTSNNDKYRKEYLRGDLEQRQQVRYKQVMKHAEYWFGDFSREQQAQIRAASNARPLNNELWMEMRMRRQQELIALLKKIQSEKPSREAAMSMLKTYVSGVLNQFGQPQHKALSDASTEASARMVATIVNIATPEQKAHAAKRMQNWIEDCRTLAGKETSKASSFPRP